MSKYLDDATIKQGSAPTMHWVIAGLGLLWNLMGGYNFFLEYNNWQNPESLTDLPEIYQTLYKATPGLLYAVFAMAVLAGIIGCIGLLMRKGWAVKVLLVSLVCVLLQMAYWLIGVDAISVLGPSSAIMPAIVIGIALALYYYAKRAARLGVIS